MAGNQETHSKRRLGRWLFVPPLVIGVVVAVALVRRSRGPQLQTATEAPRVLRVIPVPVVDVKPRVVGYGTAAPGQTWRAVTQVKGHVVETHPELDSGAIVSRGQLLVQIDPTEYQFAVAQLDADVDQVTAQIDELVQSEENYRASMTIEREALSVARRELDRLRKLADRNTIARADIDAQERMLLSQQQKLQEQSNLLNLLPTRKRALVANLALKKAQLAQAQLDLERTSIRAPFDCRFGEVSLEKDQFVSTGEVLFEATSIDLAEIEAQILPRDARRLVQVSDPIISPGALTMDRVREIFDIDVTVEMAVGELPVQWAAKFLRVRESLDPQTRTLSIVVGVEKPYEGVIPGKRPPLLAGAFCRVTLVGKTLAQRVVVPRTAIREGRVYVLDGNQRLQTRPVVVDFEQGLFAVISEGLAGGETLIVADPTPAIEGMLVQPHEDQELLNRLIADTAAKGDSRD